MRNLSVGGGKKFAPEPNPSVYGNSAANLPFKQQTYSDYTNDNQTVTVVDIIGKGVFLNVDRYFNLSHIKLTLDGVAAIDSAVQATGSARYYMKKEYIYDGLCFLESAKLEVTHSSSGTHQIAYQYVITDNVQYKNQQIITQGPASVQQEYSGGNDNNFHTLFDYTGSGKVLTFKMGTLRNVGYLKITVDGVYNYMQGANIGYFMPSNYATAIVAYKSLKIEARRGTSPYFNAASITSCVGYTSEFV